MIRLKFLALFAIAFVLTTSALAQTIQINRENKTIAISSTDEAAAIADIAAISVGYEIFRPDADSASIEAGRLSHSIMDALHKIGVEDKSIESKTQSLSRNTNFDEKENAVQRAQRQYRFEQSWEVSVSPKDAAAIIRLALAAGANQSGNIDWRLADHKALQAQAAANALLKAHSVAEQMSAGLHVKLGQLVYASNETPNAKIYFKRPNDGLFLNTSVASLGSIADKNLIPLEIHPQTIREEATVYAVFAIE